MLSAKKRHYGKKHHGWFGSTLLYEYEQTDTLCIGANEKQDVNELNQYTIWWKADAIFGIYVNV